MIKIRKATPQDVDAVADDLCKYALTELNALGTTPLESLEQGITTSLYTLVADEGGRAIAMGGVVPSGWAANVGIPWLLRTPRFTWKHSLLNEILLLRDEALGRFPVLTNIVSADNDPAIRWLTWLGATFPGDEYTPPSGVKFRRFVLEKPHV